MVETKNFAKRHFERALIRWTQTSFLLNSWICHKQLLKSDNNVSVALRVLQCPQVANKSSSLCFKCDNYQFCVIWNKLYVFNKGWKSMRVCDFSACASFGVAASGDANGSQNPSRPRSKRMLARDSSPDTFLCDSPGGSVLIGSCQ